MRGADTILEGVWGGMLNCLEYSVLIPAAPWSPKASVSLENLRRNLVITSSVWSLRTALADELTAAYGRRDEILLRGGASRQQ